MAVMAYRIAWATPDDVTTLVPLMYALYAHDVPDAPRPEAQTVRTHLERLLEPSTPHQLAIAWGPDGTALGLAAVAMFVSISDPRPVRWHQMELKELFVLETCRSDGIGQVLMAWVEARAREQGACRIDWHVKSDNDRGIAFYERFGARIVPNRSSMRKRLEE